MKAYRDITVITVGAPAWEKKYGNYIPGAETIGKVCGASAPAGVSRNRNPEGSNESDAMTFYLFTDSWSYQNIIVDEGKRYTTQDFQPWDGLIQVSALVEKP